MPSQTERQRLSNELIQAFLAQFIAETEAAYDSDSEADDDVMSIDGTDSSSTSSSGSGSSSSSSSSSSGSSSSSSDDELDDAFPGEYLLDTLAKLYSERYLNEYDPIPKSQDILHLLFTKWKVTRPEIFRSYLRIDPETFDDLVSVLSDDPVFHNNSNNTQMPVGEQVAIALFRFGHHGNAASILKVALLFGVGYGTVRRVTNRVLTACSSRRFRESSVRWANPAAKEEAMEWVEENSCAAWRKGWLMVDGSLIPLYRRPGMYENVFFDRKSNYSLAIQIISTPDLRIRDFVVALPGSQHDVTGWRLSRVFQDHAMLLEDGEWVWADSAYPLESWVQAPYKAPEKHTEENKKYNYYVSKVRIRSEHCIGFLKGRWSSLKSLRLAVDNDEGLEMASLWIKVCIALHSFAIDHEQGRDFSKDAFFRDGLAHVRAMKEFEAEWRAEREQRAQDEEERDDEDSEVILLQGKLKREQMKQALFASLDMV